MTALPKGWPPPPLRHARRSKARALRAPRNHLQQHQSQTPHRHAQVQVPAQAPGLAARAARPPLASVRPVPSGYRRARCYQARRAERGQRRQPPWDQLLGGHPTQKAHETRTGTVGDLAPDPGLAWLEGPLREWRSRLLPELGTLAVATAGSRSGSVNTVTRTEALQNSAAADDFQQMLHQPIPSETPCRPALLQAQAQQVTQTILVPAQELVPAAEAAKESEGALAAHLLLPHHLSDRILSIRDAGGLLRLNASYCGSCSQAGPADEELHRSRHRDLQRQWRLHRSLVLEGLAMGEEHDDQRFHLPGQAGSYGWHPRPVAHPPDFATAAARAHQHQHLEGWRLGLDQLRTGSSHCRQPRCHPSSLQPRCCPARLLDRLPLAAQTTPAG
mmetsp:Transcript_1398/g.4197  ORF Transcript_1398/g.4197 Transcript_1398/m.4197 type:complete len:389 (-) Transcript_1398:1103-2269(-)